MQKKCMSERTAMGVGRYTWLDVVLKRFVNEASTAYIRYFKK
jgi:hypothetical protein